jgi:hypothetical protein
LDGNGRHCDIRHEARTNLRRALKFKAIG